MSRVFLEEIWDRLRKSRLSHWFTTTFPRGSIFVGRRLLWSDPLGLKLTLGVVAAALCWFVFFGIPVHELQCAPLSENALNGSQGR